MIYGLSDIRQFFNAVTSNIYYEQVQEHIASIWRQISESQENTPSELVTFTEEEKARLTAPFFGEPEETSDESSDEFEDISISKQSFSLIHKDPSLIDKIMTIWNKYTGLSYLSRKLDALSKKYNIRLYTSYTSKLVFKENASTIHKTVQVAASLFGITHLSLIATLVVNQLFPRLESIFESEKSGLVTYN